MPTAVDCVVIGGGAIGVFTALELATAGLRVALLDKGRIAAEQSMRNWGWIRVQGRDPAEIPLAIAAQEIWRETAAVLDEDIGLRTTGVSYLATKTSQLEAYENWLPHAKAHGLTTQILTGRDVAAKLPAARSWIAALWTPTDMRAEPWLAVPAVARLAASKGVIIREDCAVRALDMAAGRVVGVVTEDGRLAAKSVVLAGGAWSSLFLARHGVRLPQLAVRSTVVATRPLGRVCEGAARDDQIAFRARTDGGYTIALSDFHEFCIGPDAFRNFFAFLPLLRQAPFANAFRPAAPRGFPDAWGTSRNWSKDKPGPFEAMRVLDPAPNRAAVQRVLNRFADTFPQLGAVRVKEAWAGMIDVTPDTVPVIDNVPDLPGLTVATGFSGHGFGIAPAAARVTARLVRGEAPGFDIARFRFGRFSDGSRLVVGPTL